MMAESKEDMAQELAMLTKATSNLCRLHHVLGLEYPKTAAFSTVPRLPSAKQVPAAARKQAVQPRGQAPKNKKAAPPSFSLQDVKGLRESIDHCERCLPESKRPAPLWGTGKQERPALLIISDAASNEGIKQGRVFPGQAGDLLLKMLAAIDLHEQDVFQANIIRCALEANEVPLEMQLKNCRPHLAEQIKLFSPSLICTMGQLASQALIGTKNRLIALRGRFHEFNGIPLMATYHPSQLLQVPDLKKAAWYDLQLIQHKLKQLGQG